MSGFIEGESRSQSTLFPERLDEYIADESSVRVIDVFIDELDLQSMGFKTIPEATGRPAYHPSILLKLYVYGYLNKVQTSRRLEQEANRNVELMWLTRRLAPDFKTIANFRKDNGKAIRQVCSEFVLVCKQLDLFSQAMVAIDGSKFKAVNNRDRNFTAAKLKRRLADVERSISNYLSRLDEADKHEPNISDSKTERLQEKIAAMKEEMRRLKKYQTQVEEAPDKQVSLTDADARSMKTRGVGIVGYNTQSAVDTKHHLIITHEVTNKGSDRDQLASVAKQAKSVLGRDKLEVVADAGYYKGEQIVACEAAGITPFVPKPQTSSSKAFGRYGKQDFKYSEKEDEYLCPAGERLGYRFTSVEKGKNLKVYWTSSCRTCPIKAQCTTGTERRIKRWDQEAVLEAMQDRLGESPEKMLIRKQTVEHPFGTIKAWMGSTHFQMRTLKHVSTEMSLHVLAYNMKRVMSIMGVKPLIEAMQA